MGATYSIYEAKTHLSEIIRQVKRRRSVTITERGREVARVVPVNVEETPAERLARLEAAGVLTPSTGVRPVDAFKPIAHRPGALRRFLRDRNRF